MEAQTCLKRERERDKMRETLTFSSRGCLLPFDGVRYLLLRFTAGFQGGARVDPKRETTCMQFHQFAYEWPDPNAHLPETGNAEEKETHGEV